jgi:DNA-binding FadR family transcriptional regulator
MPTGFDPLVAPDPANALRQMLLDGLRNGRWAPGERLPPERQLSGLLSIGRSALRRILGEFKKAGLIVQSVGSGTYVAADVHDKLRQRPSPASLVSPAELMDARILMEPMLIDLVVRQATVADFQAMEECCVRAEAAQSLEQFEHWDSALHDCIARATHNAFFVSVFDLMTAARQHGEWGMLKKKSVTPERRKRYEREHRKLVSALRHRDAETARALLEQHLQNVRFNLLAR